MAEESKRNRWLPKVVLIVATLALLGVSFVPLVGTMNSGQGNAPSAVQTPDAQRKQLEDQARGYEAVLKREPDNQNALKGLIDARRQLNDIKGTIAPLEKLVQLNPAEPQYAVLLAETKRYANNDTEGAIQTYREALKTKPGDLLLLQELSKLLINQQRPEAAIGLLQDTLREAPKLNQVTPGSVDVGALQVLLGRAFASQKRYDEALQTFDTAIKATPNDFQTYLGKALTLKDQGKDSEAKPLFDKAASLAPAQFKDQINRLASTAPTTAPTSAPGGAAAPNTAPSMAPGGTAPAPEAKDGKPSEAPSPAPENTAPENKGSEKPAN